MSGMTRVEKVITTVWALLLLASVAFAFFTVDHEVRECEEAGGVAIRGQCVQAVVVP